MWLQSILSLLFLPFLKELGPCSVEHQAVGIFVFLSASFLLVVAVVQHGTPVPFTNRSTMISTVNHFYCCFALGQNYYWL
jgi:hypothetical protein